MIAYFHCENPDCGATTAVRQFPATRYEPADVDRDTCIKCGDWLDWDQEAEEYEPDWDRIREMREEMAHE